MRTLEYLLLLATLLCIAGCGPIVSGVQTIKANIAVSAAKSAGAERHAAYEYSAAVEYLQKSREEHAYSDFWAARLYADKALSFALAARKRAEGAAQVDDTVLLPEEPTPARATPPVIKAVP